MSPDEMSPETGRVKKARKYDDANPANHVLPSPAFRNNESTTTPKRPRLAAIRPAATPSHLDLTASLVETPLTPQTPSNSKKPPKPSRKHNLATDPINTSIYDLRQQGKSWDDIAAATNEVCGLDEDDQVTAAACYSRFFRNGPLVAKARGEEWRKEWYVRMKGPVKKGVDEVNEGGETEEANEAKMGLLVEKAVVDAVETVKAEFWGRVAEVVHARLVVEGQGEKGMEVEEVKAIYDRAEKADE